MGNTARFLHVRHSVLKTVPEEAHDRHEVAFVSPHHAGNGATRSFPLPGHPYAWSARTSLTNNMVSLTCQPFLLGYASVTRCLLAGVKCLDREGLRRELIGCEACSTSMLIPYQGRPIRPCAWGLDWKGGSMAPWDLPPRSTTAVIQQFCSPVPYFDPPMQYTTTTFDDLPSHPWVQRMCR